MSTDTQVVIKKRKPNPDEGELDITPMIDITFLLLAFFVVVSKMDPQAAVDLPSASIGISVPEQESVIMVLSKSEDGTKTVVYCGNTRDEETAIDLSDEEAAEEAVGLYIQDELSANPEKKAIVIKAERNIRVGDFETVKRGINNSEFAKTRTIYAGIKEEKK